MADGDEGVVGGADGLALGGLAVHEDERVLRAWSGLGLGLGLKLGLGFGFGFGLGRRRLRPGERRQREGGASLVLGQG